MRCDAFFCQCWHLAVLFVFLSTELRLSLARTPRGNETSLAPSVNAIGNALPSYSACQFKIPKMYIYHWHPESPNGINAHPQPTNSKGTRVTTLHVTTSVSERDGTWVFLTTTTVLAFPTPLTSYDLMYHVYSTRGSTTRGATSSTLSTLLPYSPTLPAPIPSPNNMQGTHYTLATYSAIGDLFFYTSAFPEQKALQTCSPIAWLGGNLYIGFQPPVAVQFTKLQSVTYLYNSRSDRATTQGSVVLPGSPQTSSALNMYQQGPVHVATQAQKPTAVFSAMFTLPHPGIDKNTNIGPLASSATPTARPSLEVSSLPPSTPPAITWDNSVITADSATRYKIGTQTLYAHGPAITEQGTTLSLASSGEAVVVNGHTSPLVNNRPSPKPTQPAVSIGSGSYVLEGGPTVIPGGSAAVFSGTTYSALSSRTAIVINGQTIRTTLKSKDDVQVVHGLTLETARGSKVLVDGHTLAMSATLTIGSGSVFTRVALSTDSDGNTFVLGYTATSQAVNSTSVIPSLALADGPRQSTVAQSSGSSSGIGNASSATRDVQLSHSVLVAVVLVVVVFISG